MPPALPLVRSNGQAKEEPEPQRIQRGPQPRPGEAQLCQWVQALWADAQQVRDQQTSLRQWESWEQGYWGLHWPSNLPTYKLPIVINELKRLILQELSDLTDFTPTVYVSSNPRTGARDQQVEQTIQSYWIRNFLDLTVLEACADSAVWPCGFLEVVWNPLAAGGQGDAEVRVRHPGTVYPDPASPDDERWRYVILRDTMDVHEIRRLWPDTGQRVTPDASRPIWVEPGQEGVWNQFGGALVSPLTPNASPVPTQGQDTRAYVYTCYVQDSTTTLEPTTWRNPKGQVELRQVPRAKYPYGRQICCTQDVVLYDGPNPYRHGFPLVRVLLQPSLHHFWPRTSLVSELLHLQQAADKMESLTIENALRLQKGLVLIDANAGLDVRTFAEVPGGVYLKTTGSHVEFVRPPALPADLITAGARLREEMARQMGHGGARQGMAQPGNRSADLTETEISQGMGITRLRARFLQRACVRVVEKLFTIFADFYTIPRIVPYFTEDTWSPMEWQPLVKREQYAVHVDPNSFTIQSKSMVKRLAVALRKFGAMPVEDLYRILEFPRGKEIAQRYMQEMQAMAKAKEASKKR